MVTKRARDALIVAGLEDALRFGLIHRALGQKSLI